jgi:hypothetical protein
MLARGNKKRKTENGKCSSPAITAATAVLAGRRPEGLHYSCYERPAKAGRYACGG